MEQLKAYIVGQGEKTRHDDSKDSRVYASGAREELNILDYLLIGKT